MSLDQLFSTLKGGSGSGNFNHSGIPGHQGGSSPSSPALTVLATAPKDLQTSIKIRIDDMNDTSNDGVVQAAIDEISLAEDWGYEPEYHSKAELAEQKKLSNKAKKFLAKLHENGITVESKFLSSKYNQYK